MTEANHCLSWADLHQLEVDEKYPDAINELENRLACYPDEPEAVIRLGFNLWYAVVEELRLENSIPADQYARRFMQLYEDYAEQMKNNADFCWAFGLGMSMFWYFFPNATEKQGIELLEKAKVLNSFWKLVGTEEELDLSHLHGRGIFHAYYDLDAYE